MFQDRLKQLRKERKVTQVQLATHLGYFHSAVVKWESGQCEPSYDVLIKIADYFNVTLDYLLGRTEPLPLTELQRELADKVPFLSDEKTQLVLSLINQLK